MSSYGSIYEVAQRITDAMAEELELDLGVVALVDQQKQVIRRFAMSRTSLGVQAKRVLPFPYEQLDIPLSAKDNLMVKALETNQRQITHVLYDVFRPVLDENISAEIQRTVGVRTSLVYPIRSRGKPIGVMIVSLARPFESLFSYEEETIEDLLDVVGVALDNALLYQSLISTTEQLRQTNLKLTSANKKLEELDRLKDDFVSIASHELRTPMTAIRSYAWMALYKADMVLTPKLKKYLERTLISTERLINLVNDMLNISRIESGRIEIKPQPFDIQSLVGEVADEVQSKLSEKGIKLQMINTKVPKTFADPDKVHEVVLNLIGNAVKFTPKNGVIAISFFSDGKVVEVSVTDNGVGINADDLTKLFKKFGRLDSSYVAAATSGGTGLGLYICKSLVTLMQGQIWAKSDGLGKGTTFTFSIPVASNQVIINSDKYSHKPTGEAKGLEPAAI